MKRRTHIYLLIVIALLIADSASALTVQFVNKRLVVNNQPFLVKGVDESIYPISAFPTEFGACWHDPAQPSGFYCPPPSARIERPNDIDFLVQTAMGWTAALSANTYRTFGKI